MAKLPEVPEGLELEDYVAAFFQSTQHYVERNITERHVLELDIVATSFRGISPEPLLVEVKGGQWGFKDLFMTLGRMYYLAISNGLLITTRLPDERPAEFFSDRAGRKGLRVVLIDDTRDPRGSFSRAGLGEVDETAHWLWRYSFAAERKIIKLLQASARSQGDRVGPLKALQYLRLINDEVFLTSDPRERALKLYSAYSSHPRLTLGIARELDGQAFDAETPGESQSLRTALYEGAHPLLQASMYVEHRARLAVLKSVIDCLSADLAITPSRGFVVSPLPGSFHMAIQQLRESPQFTRYALFWQVLLWGWGGFILDDHRELELAALSSQTGIASENVEAALRAFDLLFPVSGGWVKSVRTADYSFVKMTPAPFAGIGVFHRLLVHKVETIQELNLGGEYTTHDLAVWYLALIRALEE